MKLAVIGAGSAGIQSVCHFIYWLGNTWEVTLIHDPTIPSLGIGESTNGSFPSLLIKSLNLELDDFDQLDATHKFGTKYKEWREQEFMGPLVTGNHALHFNTHKFKEFAITRLKSIWGKKFKEIKGNVSDIVNGQDSVELVIDNKKHSFDFVINCTGFPKDYSNCQIYNNHPTNHGLVHNIEGDYSELGYTGHRATQDGWMFEVPLKTRLSLGYLFNDKLTPVEIAKENFAKLINVPVDKLQNIEYKFTSYYNKAPLQNRVFSNGNQAFFFEPMFANSLMTYNIIDRYFYDYMMGYNNQEKCNNQCTNIFTQIIDTIYFKYHGGSTHKTPFWNYAQKASKNIFTTSSMFVNLIEVAKINNEHGWEIRSPWDCSGLYSWHGWQKLDKKLGYGVFK